jgi:DNA-binding CsgD family transcriptional regulator
MWDDFGSSHAFAVALDVEDQDLRNALSEALADRPNLRRHDGQGAPSVRVTDHPVGALRPNDPPSVIVGMGRPGALPLDADPALVLSAAHLVAAGYSVRREASTREGSVRVRLSPREVEVIDLLATGASNKHIARQLDISVHTAKFHVAAVLDKLGARNRADAVAIALREGFVAQG